uniref:NADH dehydrogenase subunit 6 n=1 Tax=Mactra quadrangularis TaxID=120570 RepID=UPI001BEEC4A8|nr:NADH dehydrogenase subunit 6 [Mactra quadrangularis]QUV72899.1 NADH dehydrogenase subunit 6 [Mactra quadrangularis]ULC79868.1 NADH dehydrogenase subunit 6 [Mactra quadrangularis]WLS55657.1 NADH dehydrogenase subunit 6 [Mactra quadrangularis]
MSWFLFLCLLLLSQFFLSQSHPIYLGGVLMVFGIFSSLVLSFYSGPLLGVCSYLVLVGGILVVFSYSVALVPVMKKDVKFSSGSLVKQGFKTFFIIMGWFLCLCQSMELGSPLFFYSSSIYFSDAWSKMVMFLGLYLLFSMIAAARMCSCYKGALIR